MKDGPDIARIAALVGDPARANMLTALIDGGALTATELAAEAAITKQTASAHIAQLANAELITRAVQGRHHYFRLADPEVAAMIEALMGVAAKRTGNRARPGPREPELRRARICYDHLAGELGVHMHDRMGALGWIEVAPRDAIGLTSQGREQLSALGLDMAALETRRRPLCRPCLDWSMRRYHLGGSVGAALLDRFIAIGWMSREADSRVIRLSRRGEQGFFSLFA